MKGLAPLVAILLLAGCASPTETHASPSTGHELPEDPDGDDQLIMIPADGSQPLPFLVQKGCTSLQGTGETTQEYAKKRLPAGLSPRLGNGGPIFAIRAWQCTTSQFANASLALGTVVTLSLQVEPEPRLQGLAEVESWWVPIAVYTATPDASQYFADFGFPVRPATITFHLKDAPGIGTTSAFVLELQDASTRMRLVGGIAMDQPAGAALARHFSLNATYVRGGLDEARAAGSTGRSDANVLTVEGPDSPSERPMTVRVVGHTWPPTLESFTWLPFEAFPEGTDPAPEP